MKIHDLFRIVQGIDVRENCREIALKNVCGYALMLYRTLKFVKKKHIFLLSKFSYYYNLCAYVFKPFFTAYVFFL